MEQTPRLEGHIRSRVQFLAEQDGPPERILKAEFAKALSGIPHVLKAYLAVVRHNAGGGYDVALCLQSITGPDERLARKLSSIFARYFGAAQYLEILFLEGMQDQAVSRVARPFYLAGVH
ncbi:MAG TPA: hypothetical protein VKV57_02265 [bacterium]|jgi:hypothetical protein|nr:hypothetical protein [bacterium]